MNSLRYVYYASRCGYRIFNVRQPAWNKKRPGVVFLETWHGTPLKKLAFDMDDITSASQNHKTLFYKHGREWNYLISANRFSTDVFERAFVYDRDKILEYGYPRNDILYADNKEEIAAEVKKELGIPEGKRERESEVLRENWDFRRIKRLFCMRQPGVITSSMTAVNISLRWLLI